MRLEPDRSGHPSSRSSGWPEDKPVGDDCLAENDGWFAQPMKVHLAPLHDVESYGLLKERALRSTGHELVSEPGSADLVLLAGSFGREPNLLLENEIYRSWADRCAVYTEDDNYLPLAPGVYCSAQTDLSGRIGRTFSYTYVSRNGRYRNGYIGDEAGPDAKGPPPEKKYLFSFLGGSTSLVRKRLYNIRFARDDIIVENTSSYFHWDDSQADRKERQRRYAETLAASHFALCPRGAGTASIRFFEAMAMGVAPVLVSDDYLLPVGPDWDAFLLRVAERDIARLPAILDRELPTSAKRGEFARQAFIEHFSTSREFDRIVDLAAQSLRHAPPSEAVFRRRQLGTIRRAAFRRSVWSALRNAALYAMKTLGIRNPYQMNR